MSFVEMPTVASSCSSPSPSQWTAPPAAWTREEIHMIQEMFLADDNVIQIGDISISDSTPSGVDDPFVTAMEQEGHATSMLLPPIKADDPFVQPSMMDEKDAMTAFFLEAIDPFKIVSMAPGFMGDQDKGVVSRVPCSSEDQSLDHVLAKLRAKVETLDRIYYARCMKVSSVDRSCLHKMKLLLAIKRLERVIHGLSQENDQLLTDTRSYAQRCDLLLQKSSSSSIELEQLCQSIGESTCAVAVSEGMTTALHCSMDGQVLRDEHDKNGWRYKSLVSPDGLFTFSLSKEYPKGVDMREVMGKSWANASNSESLSSIYYDSIRARQVKQMGKKAVVIYDIVNHDATRVDRVVAVLFRAEMSNGFVIGVRSIASPPSAASEDVRPMDCTLWQRYERKKDGGFIVTSGGRLSYPSRADIEFMAVEIMCLHLRWENSVTGGLMLLP
uniref:Uncharacterized protein n=2 Tax=Hyaloperonospora arabidopsidis (strain Emoy2) TaxID=559515 RepID=M4BPN5_HYAAE